MAKLSLKVVVNSLNEALILRTEDGNIGYCNSQGLRIMKLLSHGLFQNKNKLNKYLDGLISMDFLTLNFFNRNEGFSTNQQIEKLIMNTPLLKLHLKMNREEPSMSINK